MDKQVVKLNRQIERRLAQIYYGMFIIDMN